MERALERIGEVRRVLDLPCGTGRFTGFLSERGYEYFGADISMKMLDVLAQDRGRKPPLLRCDAEALPFQDNVFDCVLCIRFLNHHIPARIRERMVREMRRISKRWLIVQSHRLKPMGPWVALKVALRRCFGGDTNKYRIRREILREGWKERERIPIQGRPFYIGVYEKG